MSEREVCVTVPSDLHGHTPLPLKGLGWIGGRGGQRSRHSEGTAKRQSVSAHCAAPEQPHSSHTRNRVPHFTPDSGR